MAYVIHASPNVPADWASHATDLFRSTARKLNLAQAVRERPPRASWGGYGALQFDGSGGVLPGQSFPDRAIAQSVGGRSGTYTGRGI
jgi:hypothetical protein